MKTIELSVEPGPNIQELLALADHETLLLRSSYGRELILAGVDALTEEIERIRDNPELLAFLSSRGRADGTLRLEDVKRELGL